MFFYSEEAQQQVEQTPVNPGAVFLYLNNGTDESFVFVDHDGNYLEFYV